MLGFASWSQVNLNDYKYIVIPKRFDGFKKENQHQTTTIIKYLFTQKGFTTVYQDDLPVDLNSNRCLGLVVDLIDESSMFTTKTLLGLRDCNDQEVFVTQEGKSKSKDFKKAYKDAITNAFDTFNSLEYEYESKEEAIQEEEPVTISFKNDVKTMQEDRKTDRNQDPLVEQIATEEVQYYKDRQPVESNFKKGLPTDEKKMIDQTVTKEDQSFKSMEPVESDIKKGTTVSGMKKIDGILYAQEISNGYQLVDSTPKVQLKIYKSSMPNVYIAKADDKDGVVYSSDGKWFFEHYEGNQVLKEELDIKF